MDSQNLITVCIPLYNGEEFLEESLASVLSQRYEPLEILVVDDGSTDGGLDRVREVSKTDQRIRIIENEENLGLVGNWNKCIASASGKWIKFHFQDDLMEPDTIAKMHELAVRLNAGLVLTERTYFWNEELSEARARFYREIKTLSYYVGTSDKIEPKQIVEIANQDFLVQNFLGEPILGLVRKDVFERYGSYDPKLGQLVDFEFWLRIASNEPIGFISEPLHRFRIHGGSQSAKNKFARGINQTVKDRVYMCQKLLNDPHFEFYVQTTGQAKLEEMVKLKITDLIVRNGFFRFGSHFGRKVMAQSSLSFDQFRRALAKDISKAYWGIRRSMGFN